MQNVTNSASGRRPQNSLFKSCRANYLATPWSLPADNEGVREGRMFGCPAFLAGRQPFARVCEEGIGLNVPWHLAASLIKRGCAVPSQAYGKPMIRESIPINRARSRDCATFRKRLFATVKVVSERNSVTVKP